MDSEQQQSIVERYRCGDNQAFGEVFDAYSEKLYSFIYYKVHHRQTAEDLLSQTFMKAVQSFGRFDPEKGNVSSWLYRIARNLIIDHYRTHVPGTGIEDAWGLANPSSAESDVDFGLLTESVREHMAKLKPIEREIIVMRVWQEMSHAEIAEVLGKTENNCKVIFSRSVAKLRDMMPLAVFVAVFLSGWRPE